MTPDHLARIHAACFTTPRPWRAMEFADFLTSPRCFLLTEGEGFLLGQVVADEAELLTLAVAPQDRRKGAARRLVAGFLAEAANRGATKAFLEVAADNAPAIALYTAAGFAESGQRPGYYHRPDGSRIDALILTRTV